ncbi:MAG: LuxR family transcriptional regulator, partial [Gammaproteobacteria bacterium]|nr:LuxR family transcriptional regulator [Gammaproteobacteria bacterium]
MRRKSRREELMYSWHCQYYFHFTSTRKEVHAGLHRMIRDLQVDHFACFLIRISQDRSPILRPPEAFTSYPRAWIESYIRSASYLPDPIIHEARGTCEPFYWGTDRFLKPYSPLQRRVIEEAGEHGIRFGLAIPVHGPTGSFGVFIVTHRNLAWLKKRTEGEYARLYAVAFDVHEYMLDRAVAKVRRVEDALDLRDPGLLRKHEKEVLYWTLEGYPAKVIGHILGLTKNTVNQYLNVVREKLGCRTKFEAAVRASRYGLLDGCFDRGRRDLRREVYPMEPDGDRWIEGTVMVNREGEEVVRGEKEDGE